MRGKGEGREMKWGRHEVERRKGREEKEREREKQLRASNDKR